MERRELGLQGCRGSCWQAWAAGEGGTGAASAGRGAPAVQTGWVAASSISPCIAGAEAVWSWGRGQCNHPEPFPVENSWPGELLCECYMLAVARSWGCLLCRRGGSRGLAWRRTAGSGVPRLARGRGLQGGSSPAAARPRTRTESQESQSRDDGKEGKRVHPLQGAEHTPSSPCGRCEGHSAQQEHVPSPQHRELAAPAAQDRGALQVVGDVEHTSEGLCVLRRLQPLRLSTCLWFGTSSSLLPWESRHRVPSAVLSPCTEPVSGNSDYCGTVWKRLSLYSEVQTLSWSCHASWGTSMAAGLGREGDNAADMEQALAEYYKAYEDCLAGCEGAYELQEFKDFYPAIADHFVSVLQCKVDCETELTPNVGGYFVEKFVATMYHYLQFAYYKLNEVQDAVRSVSSYMLFDPGDSVMQQNLVYYRFHRERWRLREEDFEPRPEAVRYHNQTAAQKKMLEFARQYLQDDDDEMEVDGAEGLQEQDLPSDGEFEGEGDYEEGFFSEWWQEPKTKGDKDDQEIL